ncbi:MAG: hypothetical protein U5K69_11095 [Balneolaceae bacterium]|nr:hypothetical protein [Balneolaceae bacterium]
MTPRETVNPWSVAAAITALTCLGISSLTTYLDWRNNLSGIFHTREGTDWNMVWDTFSSWFLPLSLLLTTTLLIVAIVLKLLKRRHSKLQ